MRKYVVVCTVAILLLAGLVVPVSADTSLPGLIAAAPPGGTVHLAAGTYLVANGDLVIDKPLTLTGPAGAVVKLAAGQPSGAIVEIRSSNVTLEGFTVDGNAGEQTIGWSSSKGIFVLGDVSRVTIKGMEIRDVKGDAVITSGSSYVTANDNYVHDCGEGILFQFTDYFEASNNRVEDIGLDSGQDGIEPSSCSHGRITNNTIRRVGGSGIDNYENSNDNFISGNYIDGFGIGTTEPAISMWATGNNTNNRNTVIYNTMVNGYGNGIRMNQASWNRIASNTITDLIGGSGKGIMGQHGSRNNEFSTNVIRNVDVGIGVDGGNNRFVGNELYLASFGASGGGNMVIGNRSGAVNSYYKHFSVGGDNNIVIGNYVDATGDQPDTLGIVISGSRAVMMGNVVVGMEPFYAIQDTTTDSYVQGNRVYPEV